MSNGKKIVRAKFRCAVFTRDDYKCRICGTPGTPMGDGLDAHHITSRDEMPNGGYVAENGISLCPECHLKAEIMCNDVNARFADFSTKVLYDLIGSSFEKAVAASKRLDNG